MTHEDQPRIVRTAMEVQRAHDVLISLIVDQETRLVILGPDTQQAFRSIMANADVLCWLLGHEYNGRFQRDLEGVEKSLEEHGYRLIDSGRLQHRGPR